MQTAVMKCQAPVRALAAVVIAPARVFAPTRHSCFAKHGLAAGCSHIQRIGPAEQRGSAQAAGEPEQPEQTAGLHLDSTDAARVAGQQARGVGYAGGEQRDGCAASQNGVPTAHDCNISTYL